MSLWCQIRTQGLLGCLRNASPPPSHVHLMEPPSAEAVYPPTQPPAREKVRQGEEGGKRGKAGLLLLLLLLFFLAKALCVCSEATSPPQAGPGGGKAATHLAQVEQPVPAGQALGLLGAARDEHGPAAQVDARGAGGSTAEQQQQHPNAHF